MQLSIAIVNWNTSRLLADCLRSIYKTASSEKQREESLNFREVIVVDNASSDFDESAFRTEFPNVRLIINPENIGYAKGNNQAIEAASGKYIMLLNPDTQVTENAIQHLIEFMENHPDAGAAAPKLVRPNGETDRSVRSFPYPAPIAWEFLGLSKLGGKFGTYRMIDFNYDTVAEVDQPMGSCLILRRKAIEATGLFDEQFPIFFNEVDWLYRAKQNGWKIFFTPGAIIIHHGAGSTSQVDKREMRRESHDSLLKFYKKHFYRRIPALTYWFTVICIKISRRLK